jgi:hypothetical protein
MDYELAKALRDAGFQQEGRGTRVVDPAAIVARREDFAYVPTLEELIEACVPFTYGFTLLRHPEYWSALTHRDGVSVADIGTTPLEAVARLWLSLNKQ